MDLGSFIKNTGIKVSVNGPEDRRREKFKQ